MLTGPPNPLAWTAFNPPHEYMPMNDIRDHTSGMRCWCEPEVDETMAIVHRAIDRRDEYMEGRRRPS